jgi:hypothetical protein
MAWWKEHKRDQKAIVGLASVHLKFKSIKAVIRAGLVLPRQFKWNTVVAGEPAHELRSPNGLVDKAWTMNHVLPNGGQKTKEQVSPNGGHCNNGYA